MLDEYTKWGTRNGVFLTSYIPTLANESPYDGDTWVGRNESSERGGYTKHCFQWIEQKCRERRLLVEELDTHKTREQVWLRIVHAS